MDWNQSVLYIFSSYAKSDSLPVSFPMHQRCGALVYTDTGLYLSLPICTPPAISDIRTWRKCWVNFILYIAFGFGSKYSIVFFSVVFQPLGICRFFNERSPVAVILTLWHKCTIFCPWLIYTRMHTPRWTDHIPHSTTVIG